MLELLKGTIRTIISGNDRNDEGARMRRIGPMCGPDYHNWNNFCGIVFESTMDKIALFVTPQVQIFDHILKYF